jgi:hypothetical protein
MDPRRLDDAAAEALLSGQETVPPGYEGLAATLSALAALRSPASPDDALLARLEAATAASAAAETVAPPAPSTRRRRAVQLAGVAAALLVLVVALGTVNALPATAQRALSGVFGEIGVAMPSPDDADDDQPVPATMPTTAPGSSSTVVPSVPASSTPLGLEPTPVIVPPTPSTGPRDSQGGGQGKGASEGGGAGPGNGHGPGTGNGRGLGPDE